MMSAVQLGSMCRQFGLRGGQCQAAAAADGWYVATVEGSPLSTGNLSDANVFWRTTFVWVDEVLASATALHPLVRLVVFPEFSLLPPDFATSCNTPQDVRVDWCPPFRDAIVMGLTGRHRVDAALARLARRHRIAFSINGCDGQPEGNYNAQLFYGANGALHAKYHKAHPWFRRCFATPAASAPVVVVNTSFGGPLGVFTCLDIAHNEPGGALLERGVRTVVYSSMGVLGVVKRWWTMRHGATLLASDGFAIAGSGVYRRGRRLKPEVSGSAGGSGWRVLVTRVPQNGR